ncbi:MAG: rRNA maturation RNase YbeY [Thermoanaerobaculales bacterium]
MAFRWRRRAPGRLTGQLRRLAQEALGRLGYSRVEVGVLFCDDATIRTLNRHFRDEDAATDVLSFPAGDEPGESTPYLGDIAISVETAARQAREVGVELVHELETLLLHGLVHLAGFDHETDSGEMAALESRLRRELMR